MKKISLSLERDFYKLVCRYADLFCLPNSEMMQLLLSAGIGTYEIEPYRIYSSKAAYEDKEKIKKYKSLLYITKEELAGAEEIRKRRLQNRIDEIEFELKDAKMNVSKRIVRPKMNIKESYYEFIKDIISKEKEKGNHYTYSDIVYTLIRHSLYKELDVLRYAGNWGENAMNIFSRLETKEIVLNIPEILYFGMFACAQQKGVNVQTYMKAVLYDNFVANKDLIVNEWKNGILPNTKSETAQSK